jgi:hypothetical protein
MPLRTMADASHGFWHPTRALGLPRWAVEIIPTLTPGVAVWDVNGNVQVVKHLITRIEEPLVFTDRAMTEA